MQHFRPDDVAVAFDYGVRVTPLQRFFWVEGRVNAAIDDPCATLPREPANLVAAQGIPGVNADAHQIARLDGRGDEGFERLVNDDRIAK